jgi:Ricin-type beta-trefoil lectin domain-like
MVLKNLIKMKNLILFICSCVTSISCFATNYFVSGNGRDDNDGKSIANAFRNIQKAADLVNAGDTVFVLNGTYNPSCFNCEVVIIRRSGEPNKPIVFINYQNHKPLIKPTYYNGFLIIDGASYIEINGFTIQGNTDAYTIEQAKNQGKSCQNPNGDFESQFNTNGISADGRSAGANGPHPHHLRFLNNEIYKCGGGGISAIETDYVTIQNNNIHDNCTQTLFGASGISMLHNWNKDNNTSDYKMIVINNRSYNNILNVEWIGPDSTKRVCEITDGNGIIIDDTKCSQTNAIKYLGKTLVANNICYNNGGAGILAFSSENVDMFSNTVYFNQRSKNIKAGDLHAAFDCNNIKAYNNIIYTNPNNLDNENKKKPINSLRNGLNIDFNYNLVFGGNDSSIDKSNSVKNVDPRFVNAALGNFKLQTTSPAIDKGTSDYIIYKDAEGNARPQGNAADIGAYETNVNANSTIANGTYILTAKHSGKVLDVKASSTQNGAVVWQYARNNGIAQQWQVTSLSNGFYKLEATCSNKALDVSGISLSNGAPLQQWGYNSSNPGNQDFKIEPTNKGFYKLTARNSGKAVEVGGSNSNSEAAIIQWDYYNGDNQQWIFEKINNGSSSKNIDLKIVNINQNDVTLNPNPAENNTLITYEIKAPSLVVIQLLDINQKLLKNIFTGRQTRGKYNQNINLGSFVNGIYFIKIAIGNEPIITEKIIKL